METTPSVLPHTNQPILLFATESPPPPRTVSSDSAALFQHGSSLAPDLLHVGSPARIVAGLPGRRPPTTPVWLPPGRRPLPGLWGERLLLRPQERRGPSDGFPALEGGRSCSHGRRERSGRVCVQGPDGDDGEARHRGAVLPQALQHLRPAELLQLNSAQPELCLA